MTINIWENYTHGSGDWIMISNDEGPIFSGHRITLTDLTHILRQCCENQKIDIYSLTDAQMETLT